MNIHKINIVILIFIITSCSSKKIIKVEKTAPTVKKIIKGNYRISDQLFESGIHNDNKNGDVIISDPYKNNAVYLPKPQLDNSNSLYVIRYLYNKSHIGSKIKAVKMIGELGEDAVLVIDILKDSLISSSYSSNVKYPQTVLNTIIDIGPIATPLLNDITQFIINLKGKQRWYLEKDAALSFCSIGTVDSNAIPLLVEMLDDVENNEKMIAASAALSLSGSKGINAIPKLQKLYNHYDEFYAICGSIALSGIEQKDVYIQKILSILENSKNNSNKIKIVKMIGLSRIFDNNITLELMKIATLTSQAPHFIFKQQLNAIESLRFMTKDNRVVPVLISIAEDKELYANTRVEAINSLSYIGHKEYPKIKKTLLNLIKLEKNIKVKRSLLKAIQKMKI